METILSTLGSSVTSSYTMFGWSAAASSLAQNRVVEPLVSNKFCTFLVHNFCMLFIVASEGVEIVSKIITACEKGDQYLNHILLNNSSGKTVWLESNKIFALLTF